MLEVWKFAGVEVSPVRTVGVYMRLLVERAAQVDRI
jgi:hypothetical protein